MVHRTEHSIEFQAVMLSYLYGSAVRIVPILCASFFGAPLELSPLVPLPEVGTSFSTSVVILVDAAPGQVSVIAGADLAHVGRRFGDSFDIHDSVLRQVEARDERISNMPSLAMRLASISLSCATGMSDVSVALIVFTLL